MKEGIREKGQMSLDLQPEDPISGYSSFLEIPENLRKQLEDSIDRKTRHGLPLYHFEQRFLQMQTQNEADLRAEDQPNYKVFTNQRTGERRGHTIKKSLRARHRHI